MLVKLLVVVIIISVVGVGVWFLSQLDKEEQRTTSHEKKEPSFVVDYKKPPLTKTFWIRPGLLLAGRYPGELDPVAAENNLRTLLAVGIRVFINLQEADEVNRDGQTFANYQETVSKIAEELGLEVNCYRLPIVDMEVTTESHMQEILELIDESISTNRPVYVHCWGGHGRTGTVVGCWLRRHGLGPERALERIMELRQADAYLRDKRSPQTSKQIDMVKSWPTTTELLGSSDHEQLENRFMGAILGLVVGDALGAPYEFKERDSFEASPEYGTGGPHSVQQGEWTDDSSMALCAAESLSKRQQFEPADMIERWRRWWGQGYMSTRGRCFDIGHTTRKALENFVRGKAPFECGSTDPDTAGNGSLMRLAPIPLFYMTHPRLALDVAVKSSRLTHAAPQCLDACHYFAGLLLRALSGVRDKDELLSNVLPPNCDPRKYHPEIESIAQGDWKTKTREQIESGGYVAHTLEAALWCFYNTENFLDGALMAVNLGRDTDTTGAVYGQIAGAYYGLQDIPVQWLDTLMWREKILRIAGRLFQRASHEMYTQGMTFQFREVIPLSPVQQEHFESIAGLPYEGEFLQGSFKTSNPWGSAHNGSPWTFSFQFDPERKFLFCQLEHRMTNNRTYGWDWDGNPLPKEVVEEVYPSYLF